MGAICGDRSGNANCSVTGDSYVLSDVDCVWRNDPSGYGERRSGCAGSDGDYECDCGCAVEGACDGENDCGCNCAHGDGCGDVYDKCCAPLSFTKYSSFGNDFLILTAENTTSGGAWRISGAQLAQLARRYCDRHNGVGADGLLSWRRTGVAPNRFELWIFNADGSEAEMCGNGLRAWSSWWFSRCVHLPVCADFDGLNGLSEAGEPDGSDDAVTDSINATAELGATSCCKVSSSTRRIELITLAGTFPVIARWAHSLHGCTSSPLPNAQADVQDIDAASSISACASSAQLATFLSVNQSASSQNLALVLQEIGIGWAYYPKLRRTYQLSAGDLCCASPLTVEDWDSGVPHALLWVDELPNDWLARSAELAYARFYQDEGKTPKMATAVADQSVKGHVAAVDQSGSQSTDQPAAGTNVDWLVMDSSAASAKIKIYTWERGVGHSLACGTGSIAAAASYFARQSVLSALAPSLPSPASSAELLISYSGCATATVKIKLREQTLWLYGPPACPICQGVLL